MRSVTLAVVALALMLVVGLAVLSAGVRSDSTTTGTSSPALVGPRAPVGPDVPLSGTDKAASGPRVTVAGLTSEAIQTACDLAAKQSIPVVFLPAGIYIFDSIVHVPGGITLLGEGASTLCQERFQPNPDGFEMFLVQSDRVRFTRMKMQGKDISQFANYENMGVLVDGGTNVHVDHCEMMLLARGVDFRNEASGQVDHCFIHDNVRSGLGYGISVTAGAYVLVTDNETGQCRHVLASNGYSGRTPGRNAHWEFLHNHVGLGDSHIDVPQAAVDAHAGYVGTFVIEANHFELYQKGIGMYNGMGLIEGNLFENVGEAIFTDLLIEDRSVGHPHHFQISENTFLDGVYVKYRIDWGYNMSINGSLVPHTIDPNGPEVLDIPCLQEMGDDGILRWSNAGSGSVTGTVTDEAGKPVGGATVLIGERSATTDAQGQFHLDGVSEAARFCVVMKVGFQRVVVGLSVRRNETATVGVPLRSDAPA